ncbi:MAG: redoxin domain-containing protein [Deltaproteobacteria bacterium]|nr:redoxin domain-containing protein [Deltaproteobacteria bacterium]
MKRGKYLVIGVIFCMLPFTGAGAADSQEIDYSGGLAKIKLLVPAEAKVRESLGLKQASGLFSLSEVKADILIVEIFSMYCPYCQRHAPMANKLYQAIQGRKDLKDRVKLIGIGIGNSAYEVNIFRQKYAVGFPLFEDKGGTAINSLPGIRTPHYFGIKKGAGSSFDVFFSRQGPYDDEKVFLDGLLKKSGIRF